MSIFLDGVGDYLSLNQAIGNGWSSITICSWIFSNETNTDNGFIIFEPPDGTDQAGTIRYDAGGFLGGGTNLIKTGLQINGNIQHNVETQSNVQVAGAWQHVAMTWTSGSNIVVYIDGVLATLTGVANANPVGTISGHTELFIGRGAKDESPTTTGWSGFIDDTRLYDRALSADEIQTIFALRGRDSIIDNLQFRYVYQEAGIGQLVSTITDISSNGRDLTTVAGTPSFGSQVLVNTTSQPFKTR